MRSTEFEVREHNPKNPTAYNRTARARERKNKKISVAAFASQQKTQMESQLLKMLNFFYH